MKRAFILLSIVAVAFATCKSAYSMRKITAEAAKTRLAAQSQGALGKSQPGPSLSIAQQAAIGRRVSNLESALASVRLVGSAQASFPPGVIDGILDWQTNGAADVQVWWDSETQTPFFIKGRDLSLPAPSQSNRQGMLASAATALNTLDRVSGLIGLTTPSEELRPILEVSDGFGMYHVRFQQVFRDCEVWGRTLAVHFDKAGNITSIDGRWSRTPKPISSWQIRVTEQEALETVESRYSSNGQASVDSVWSAVYVDESNSPHLAWAVRVTLSPTEAFDSFVDAETGEFLHESSLVCSDGPVVGSGTDLSGATRTVNAYQLGSTYYMINTTKPMLGTIVVFDCGTGYLAQTTNVNSWANPAAVSASYMLGKVYDYFLNRHSRNSLDGNGGTIRAYVNYTDDPGNAFFVHGSQSMVFGAGAPPILSNLAGAIDVAAHEMGHGVVNTSAGLKNESQPGALNESFADVFGVMTEFYELGASGDWLIGEDVITPAIAGDCLRNMADPGNANVNNCCGGPQPTHMSQYAILPNTAAGDRGGVHVNSGIPNRAFYLSATSIGRDKADSIWYRALLYHLSPFSQFVDLRLAALQAASFLYPGNATIYNSVASAFNTVGITDGSPTVPPDDLPVPTSAQWIVSRDEVTGRAVLFDTSGVFIRYVSGNQVTSKPSAPDSGNVIYFVDQTFNITAVDKFGTWEVQLGDAAVDFNSVAVSPDNSRLAFFIQADPTLYLYDLVAGQNMPGWVLYSPTYTAGGELFDVLYPDVLEWTLDGNNVVFDCACFLPIQNDTLIYWDIRTINVQSGLISRTLPTVAPGLQVGNPSLGRIHFDLMTFDYIRSDDSVFVNTANLSNNTFAAISVNGTSYGRPSFSPSDTRIILQYDGGTGNNLWKISYNPESNQAEGSFQSVASSASFANWRFEGRDTPSGVFDDDDAGSLPIDFTLDQNYPNPFNAVTTVGFTVAHDSKARFDVFNVLGQHVYQRDLGLISGGQHSLTWDAHAEDGTELASGVYFYRITLGRSAQTRKMVLLK